MSLSSPSLSPFPPFPLSPSVVIVGAGRLGSALAYALASCGYAVVALVARRGRRAARAATLLGGTARALSAAQLEELPAANLLFITTPDDEVAATATRLAALAHIAPPPPAATRAGQRGARASASVRPVALHTSGALSSDALAPLSERGFAVGSMHPLVSVSEPVSGAESLRRAFYCIEGEHAAVRAARHLVGQLGGHSFSIATKDKALYHAAAVMASGHTVALFQLATELLARCGLAEREARRVLLPLLQSTLENLSAQTPARALTGTFARADIATVRKHLAALNQQDTTRHAHAATTLSDATDIYALLGLRSLQLAAQNGADAAALAEIARLLDSTLAGENQRVINRDRQDAQDKKAQKGKG